LLDSLFNVFGGRHTRDITPVKRLEKVRGQEFIPARSPGSARR
jgi:hypothetical protein